METSGLHGAKLGHCRLIGAQEIIPQMQKSAKVVQGTLGLKEEAEEEEEDDDDDLYYPTEGKFAQLQQQKCLKNSSVQKDQANWQTGNWTCRECCFAKFGRVHFVHDNKQIT